MTGFSGIANESIAAAVGTPVACSFPDLVDSSPKNLLLCLIYFIGTGSAAAVAIYLYLRERKNRTSVGGAASETGGERQRNGHTNN